QAGTPTRHPLPDRESVLHPDAPPVDAGGGDPAVDAAAVVADLEALPLDRLDEMQVLPAAHLAQHDVPDLQRGGVHRRDRAELAGLDLALHGVAPRAEGNRLARLELLDVF